MLSILTAIMVGVVLLLLYCVFDLKTASKDSQSRCQMHSILALSFVKIMHIMPFGGQTGRLSD